MTALILETRRFFLRPLEESDHAALLKVLGDAETMVFYPELHTAKMVERLIHRNRKRFDRHGYGRFAVIEKDTRALVGDCGITIQDIQGRKEHEIGYHIRKDKWGRGYAPEAAAAIMEYGFGELGLERLCSYMVTDHHQSRRVAEKIGMRLETQYRNPRNRNRMTAVYAMTSDGLQMVQ